jgi:hypothetical protein
VVYKVNTVDHGRQYRIELFYEVDQSSWEKLYEQEHPVELRHCPIDPLALMAAIMHLTSEGNNEGLHGDQGARPIPGDPSLVNREGDPRVNDG